MTPVPGAPATTHNLPILAVSELSAALKRTIEDAFGVVRVRGEISQPKVAGSGHCYLRLKDERAVLDAVIWRGTMARLGARPEDGLEVVCTGRLTTYPGRSTYQIIIESMEVAGEGALLKMIEDRRKRLKAEGLFDEARKRPLPFLPEVIGVITSPTGAVIRDILHRLAERFPRHVLLWPVLVQGESAAAQVAEAITGFNRLDGEGGAPRPDLIIVARGGGSLEDLMAFNDEAVVRAVAASAIPLISAVGHETDTTLIDYAADRRAPTPSAAAEIAVPVRAELAARIAEDGARLTGAATRFAQARTQALEGLARGLPDPGRILDTATQRTDEWGERLRPAMGRWLEQRRSRVETLGHRLPSPHQYVREKGRRLDLAAGALRVMRGHTDTAISQSRSRLGEGFARLGRAAARRLHDEALRLSAAGKLLDSFSYERVLERGFVLVRDAAGAPVLAAARLKPGDAVSMRFHDGAVGAVVRGAPAGDGPPVSGGPRRSRKTKSSDVQGQLL